MKYYSVCLTIIVVLCAPLFASYVEEEEHVPEIEVEAVLGHRVELPCDIAPFRREDSVHMVLWFKDDTGKPLYSWDVRGKPFSQAKHWSSDEVFGSRAHFLTLTTPARLVVDRVELKDAGGYRCRVDFRNSPTRNAKLNLTIIVPPQSVKIYDSSEREVISTVGTYSEGSDILLKCDALGGDPIPTVAWYLEETLVDNVEELIEEDRVSNQILLTGVTRDHLGANLTCLASNTNLTSPVHRTVRIELNLRPLYVRILPRPAVLSANRKYGIECIAVGSRPSAMITWWMANRQLTDVTVQASGDNNITRSTLTLIPSIEDHGRLLTCRAENPWVPGSVLEDTWRVNVVYRPVAQLRLGSALDPDDIEEGDDVYFECHLQANPPVHRLLWLHQGKVLTHNVTSGIIMSNQSLVLQLVTRASSGNYTCLAVNAEGQTTSNPVFLRVQYAPVCRRENPVILGVSREEHIAIRCEVDTDPVQVSFRWEFDNSGEVIAVPPARYYNRGPVSVLNYTPMSSLDYGTLTCRAANAIGQQTSPCVFQVVAAERPSSVRNCTLFNQTSESLEVDCLPGFDGGLPQTFVLELFESKSGELRYNLSNDSPSFHLGNLAAGSTFYILLYAVNVKGRSEPVKMEEVAVKDAQKRTATPEKMDLLPFLSILLGAFLTLLCITVAILAHIFYKRRSQQNQAAEADKNAKINSKKPPSDMVTTDGQTQVPPLIIAGATLGRGGVPGSDSCSYLASPHIEMTYGKDYLDDRDPDVIPSQYDETSMEMRKQFFKESKKMPPSNSPVDPSCNYKSGSAFVVECPWGGGAPRVVPRGESRCASFPIAVPTAPAPSNTVVVTTTTPVTVSRPNSGHHRLSRTSERDLDFRLGADLIQETLYSDRVPESCV